ncbi:MAG: T9SS type A sorting domain-containing protein [Bacteroidia bacterium]
MKKYFLICFIILFSNVNAQTYNLGTPIYDTLRKQSMNYMNVTNCPLGETSIDTILIKHMPTGVNLYFKIISSTLSNGCLNITGLGVMNTGDSSLITPTNKKFEWSALCGGGNATYAIIAIGTPTVAGDSFYCKSQWHDAVGVAIDGCGNYMMADYFSIGDRPSCVVDSLFTNSINTFHKPTYSIYPNPFTKTATIETQSKTIFAVFEMFDIRGQKVKQFQINNSKTDIIRDNLSAGVYFYQIISGDKFIDRGKIIIE